MVFLLMYWHYWWYKHTEREFEMQFFSKCTITDSTILYPAVRKDTSLPSKLSLYLRNIDCSSGLCCNTSQFPVAPIVRQQRIIALPAYDRPVFSRNEQNQIQVAESTSCLDFRVHPSYECLFVRYFETHCCSGLRQAYTFPIEQTRRSYFFKWQKSRLYE